MSATQQPSQYPAYELEKLDGTYTKTVYKYKPTGHKTDKGGDIKERVTEEVEVDAGYMLYSPKGSSVRVSAEYLTKMGINPHKPAPIVDDETGEVVAVQDSPSLKQQVLSTVTERNRRR